LTLRIIQVQKGKAEHFVFCTFLWMAFPLTVMSPCTFKWMEKWNEVPKRENEVVFLQVVLINLKKELGKRYENWLLGKVSLQNYLIPQITDGKSTKIFDQTLQNVWQFKLITFHNRSMKRSSFSNNKVGWFNKEVLPYWPN